MKQGPLRLTACDGRLQPAIVEPPTVFSPARLDEWAQTYPYGYKDAQAIDAFHVSTESLGVSELPSRAVLVASTGLQGFPPNLLRVGPDLAGRDRRLAAAPSLTWLHAARRNSWRGDGRINAWIPDAAPDEGWPTLAIIAERLRSTFQQHNVALSSGAEPLKIYGDPI